MVSLIYCKVFIAEKEETQMNKNKILSALLVLTMAVCMLTACGDAKTPGEKNSKLTSETPDSIGLVDDKLKTGAEDVTSITGSTDLNGKTVDSKGIKDKAGHMIYSTGQKDADGNIIYTTGKKDTKGNILYTKNKTDTFGNMIYYTGKYDKNGKLTLEQTNETPDYTSNEVPSTKVSPTEKSTSTTVGEENPSNKRVESAECEYTKYFGGTGLDTFRDVAACKDGGYLVAGVSGSTDGDYSGVSADWDELHTAVVKYSADGKAQWKYILGGDKQVSVDDIIELKDGTVIAAGQTSAEHGEIVKTAELLSAFVIRLKADGTLMWKYVFPADSTSSYIDSLAATPDGGFVAGGKAISKTGFFNGTREGGTKAFIFKFDKNCNIKWRRILEGEKSNNISALAVNSDGDIYATCVTYSSDGDFSAIKYNTLQSSNTVLLKLKKNGDLEWAEYLQGSGDSEYSTVFATEDGGCVVGGSYNIYKKADGIYDKSYGGYDGYVLRYNAKGQVCWSRIIGGSGNDRVLGIAEVEGGYAVVGQTDSDDLDFQGYKAGGGTDGFILYLNAEGKTTQTVRLNGELDDGIMDTAVLTDGSIAVVGWTKSSDQAFNGSNAKKQYMAFASRYSATVK